MRCLICGGPQSLEKVGDDTKYDCCRYRLGSTVVRMLQSGAKEIPEPEAFRAVVDKERGDSTRWPVITTQALGW